MISVCFSLITDTGELLNSDKTEQHIRRIADGDKNALSLLYEETRNAVYGFVLSILKSPYDAEDVLQDTYIQIFRSAASYKSAGKPMAWIFTIARNFALMKLRNDKKNIDIEDADLDRYYSENDRITTEDKITLNAMMRTLSEEEAQIVIMHAVTGLKNREIAEALKLPLSTVLSKYNRAIKKLRTKMEGDEDND